jgi:hypothetical protein
MVDSFLDSVEPFRIGKFVLEQIRELGGGETISGDAEELPELERGGERRLPNPCAPLSDSRLAQLKDLRRLACREVVKADRRRSPAQSAPRCRRRGLLIWRVSLASASMKLEPPDP